MFWTYVFKMQQLCPLLDATTKKAEVETRNCKQPNRWRVKIPVKMLYQQPLDFLHFFSYLP